MALVVICGQPCSGKSTAALCLASALEATEPKPKIKLKELKIGPHHIKDIQDYALWEKRLFPSLEVKIGAFCDAEKTIVRMEQQSLGKEEYSYEMKISDM
ncbi:hypothetical protein HPP92_017176 [Vanilla planifolia]|uniref:Uncharacterized protein n=1 Tax=Vanilla planifolia TaxID=51239 RepID=A0A835QAN4_VANPL|nr:hypothetical protein HPP92_017176 [Vanilla planifolia]